MEFYLSHSLSFPIRKVCGNGSFAAPHLFGLLEAMVQPDRLSLFNVKLTCQ